MPSAIADRNTNASAELRAGFAGRRRIGLLVASAVLVAGGAGAPAVSARLDSGPTAVEAADRDAAGDPAAAAASAVQRLTTVAGELTVAEQEGGADPVFSVRLAGELVREFDAGDDQDALGAFPRPEVLRRFEPGVPPYDEVVLFQQHGLGNACNGGPLWLLGLRRDGSWEASGTIDFCGGLPPEVSSDGERVRIHLPGGPPNRGEGCIPPETWDYERGEVRHVARAATPAGPAAREPWDYCRTAGTVDEPAPDRLGPEAAAALHGRVREAFDLADEMPAEAVSGWTVWRCMDGEVWACIVGANLPCSERADLSRTPAESLLAYCRDHPDSDVVPAVVTGRATVYSWRCTGGRPEVERQWSEPDERGFHGEIWRQLCPPDR